ncbi:SidA/IucD/PvdA family monooxygenase [Rhizobium mongolense]|uniref:L-ornithine N5-oxygenase n=4 Tax=Rhizobium mongolense TaxID=57676 RepID=A0ABR6IZJ1_9HYPH|nr:SidA/IucD/PvdA family monooxygenase [Rhizobium mongolense]MBB4233346.1 L-ornithine N5-oxygenase [Rhizobium mongolense]TVZ75317.1 L-ornithine N5-oxygenase [Rhizobium mongolense USDA 1844]
MQTFDILGIGFGPSNIALAIALEELGGGTSSHFIERATSSRWQPNMLLTGSDIQNNPLRDLVTPRNPRSRYSFTNYLSEVGRLLEYLNLGLHFPLRSEYSQYIEWVAEHFRSDVTYGCNVWSVEIQENEGTGARVWKVITDSGSIAAKTLVLGTGRAANIPIQFEGHLGERVFHLTEYNDRIEVLAKRGLRSIAVLGASQSAVEILLDLMARFPQLEIHSVHRSFSMRQKDTSPFSEHVYFPEFIEYYFPLPSHSKEDLRRQLRQANYSSADIDVLNQLYVRLYEEKIRGLKRFHRHNNTVIRTVTSRAECIHLDLEEHHLNLQSGVEVDAVVLATGFRDVGAAENCELCPQLLEGVLPQLETDERGGLIVRRNYEVKEAGGLGLYLNGLCENSHGMGDAGSFSLLSIRADEIARSMISQAEMHSSYESNVRSYATVGGGLL